MKSFKKNTIVIFIISVVVLYFILKDDFSNIVNDLFSANIWFFLLALGCFLIYLLCKSESLRIVAVKNNKDFTFKKSFLQNLIVQFFNGVTPFQTGGQPMQVYMLTKNKLNISKATNVVIQEFIFYQVALVLFGSVAVLLNLFFGFFAKVKLLKLLVLCGFAFNVFIVFILLIVSCNDKITNFFIKGLTKLLIKIKVVKNKEKVLKKVDNRLKEFHGNAKYLLSNKKMFVKGIIVNFIGLLFLYITPLFVALSFGLNHLNILEVITASAYVYLVGSFIPIPGASVGFEYSFLSFFGNFISGSVLPALLIIFRTITYYLPVIVGAIVFNFYKGDEE